jgi:hypothetical protein
MTTKGVKHDSTKPDYSLLPFGAVDEVVKVLTYGAQKYDRFNWEHVEDIRYQAAALRHISSYMQGEKYDPETGINHLAHAVCSLLFLVEFDRQSAKKEMYKPEGSCYNVSYNGKKLNDATPAQWDAAAWKVNNYETK